MQERPIPEAAIRDPNSVEMMRVWIAEGGLHCSLKVGMYRETMNIPEETAWGTILADAARHVANALSSGYGVDADQALRQIGEALIKELALPTSDVTGSFR